MTDLDRLNDLLIRMHDSRWRRSGDTLRLRPQLPGPLVWNYELCISEREGEMLTVRVIGSWQVKDRPGESHEDRSYVTGSPIEIVQSIMSRVGAHRRGVELAFMAGMRTQIDTMPCSAPAS
jgi:hypothetical protein